MTIIEWLIEAVGPLTARWLAAMGLSAVTITGLQAGVDGLKNAMVGALGGIPSDLLGFIGLAGVYEAAGIGLGSLSFVVAWRGMAGAWALSKS